jgi:hypothetical protein
LKVKEAEESALASGKRQADLHPFRIRIGDHFTGSEVTFLFTVLAGGQVTATCFAAFQFSGGCQGKAFGYSFLGFGSRSFSHNRLVFSR